MMKNEAAVILRVALPVVLLALIGANPLSAQTAIEKSLLPDAPAAQLVKPAQAYPHPSQKQENFTQSRIAQTSFAEKHSRLTRGEAEQMALKNNPRVSVARLLALAQHQV